MACMHAYILFKQKYFGHIILAKNMLPNVFKCMHYLTMRDFIDTTGFMCVFIGVSFNLQICVSYHVLFYISMFMVLCML